MEHEGNRPHPDGDDDCRRDEQDRRLGGRIVIQLKMPILLPPTVLLTELDDGTLILQGPPDGPRVRLSSTDAGPLKRELVAALERARRAATADDQGDTQ